MHVSMTMPLSRSRHTPAMGLIESPMKEISRIVAFIAYSFSELSGIAKTLNRFWSICCAYGWISPGVYRSVDLVPGGEPTGGWSRTVRVLSSALAA